MEEKGNGGKVRRKRKGRVKGRRGRTGRKKVERKRKKELEEERT